jgi:hypothetical protein
VAFFQRYGFCCIKNAFGGAELADVQAAWDSHQPAAEAEFEVALAVGREVITRRPPSARAQSHL